MPLKSLLKSVLPHFQTSQYQSLNPSDEADMLADIPVETLYLAIKEASSDDLAWLFQNANGAQIQALMDLDCWQGDSFQPERFENFFKFMTLCDPAKLASHMKEADPEFIVRGLREFFVVHEYDPREPMDIPEAKLLLTPDSRFALELKTESPEVKELLYLWLNKFSAGDLGHLRFLLESCKWEEDSSLEENCYRAKKGRLEDLGFVDYFESISLYAVGNSTEFKQEMLNNPLSAGTKSSVSRKLESQDEYQSEHLFPLAVTEGVEANQVLGQAFSQITDPGLREIIFMEMVRTLNASLSADKILQADLETIQRHTRRARKYLELGLLYINDGQVKDLGSKLEQQPLEKLYRLGWLLTYDLSKVAQRLAKEPAFRWLTNLDRDLILALSNRHPTLDSRTAADLGLISTQAIDVQTLESISKCGERLSQLAALSQYLSSDLGGVLHVNIDSETPISAFARLCHGLLRQQATETFTTKALSTNEWRTLTKNLDAHQLKNLSKTLWAKLQHPGARALAEKRMNEAIDDVANFVKSNPEGKIPDARFFQSAVVKD